MASATGAPLTSNYILRYRDLLRQRGQWRLYATVEEAPRVDIIVRLARRTDDPPSGATRIFQDSRFIAWRLPPRGPVADSRVGAL